MEYTFKIIADYVPEELKMINEILKMGGIDHKAALEGEICELTVASETQLSEEELEEVRQGLQKIVEALFEEAKSDTGFEGDISARVLPGELKTPARRKIEITEVN